MSSPERRRYTRYRVRLSIQFLRGEAEVAAEIFNISRSGCLFITPVALQVGERVEVYLPAFDRSPQSFRVVRTRRVGPWFAVAADFEPYLLDEAPLARLADGDEEPEENLEQLF
ncbi:PilZ domain-containing protein [Archangium sp.]|uniref:PilZ domain-containing protein n=1 Tax=Archangium sp. TaxID=1872627 RepID=UPI002D4D8A10|nr:PilZ domain-containing protein [Archangium sp.]HYO54303.1 PilZ domain-containing protein [Archangium sp.]